VSNDSQVADHPERLGDLAPIFERRRIVFAVDELGQLVLVRPDSVVVDTGETPDEFVRAVEAVAKLDPKRAGELRERGPRQGGLVSVHFQNEPTNVQNERRFSARPVQTALDRLREAGARAEPNHVVIGSQIVRGVPVGAEAHFAGGMVFTAELIDTPIGKVLKSTSDPAPPPAWLPEPLQLENHRQPRILVLDTGLRTDGTGTKVEHPKLTCVKLHSPWVVKSQPGEIDDEDEIDDDNSGTLDFEAGHGTFITGIIQQICPDAEVHIGGVLSSFGDGDVATVIATFEHALERVDKPFDLVVMSLGCYLNSDEGALFEAALRRLLGNGLGVAAAGNQATSRKYFPAACPDIVGVGGLGQADKAWFTNFGSWVDACAPAIDVVSTFFTRSPRHTLDEPPFTGWARWSGTSFAAPKVAAVIAQEMYLTKQDARTVWRRVSDYRRYRFPDLGTVFNVGP